MKIHTARVTTLLALCALAALTSACDDGTDDGDQPGTFTASVYGEPFIEVGIPADEFSDDWAVTFDRFIVVVSEVRLGNGQVILSEPRVFDVAKPSQGAGHAVASAEVPGGRYTALAYTIAPSAEALAGNVDEATRALVTASNWSVYVEGRAVRGDVTKRFAWGFDTATTYDPCEIEVHLDGSQGRAQLTIHGDHLFYDDLVSEEPELAFDLIAQSDVDGDGEITLEELAQTDITGQARYQVGSADITQLAAYLAAQTRTLGHIDGEGHCGTR